LLSLWLLHVLVTLDCWCTNSLDELDDFFFVVSDYFFIHHSIIQFLYIKIYTSYCRFFISRWVKRGGLVSAFKRQNNQHAFPLVNHWRKCMILFLPLVVNDYIRFIFCMPTWNFWTYVLYYWYTWHFMSIWIFCSKLAWLYWTYCILLLTYIIV
jgi:hypothetical protein